MPYESDKQRRWAHTTSGILSLGKKTVKEFDNASKGLDLPETKNAVKEAYKQVKK